MAIVIDSFSPESAYAGGEVSLIGSGFTGATNVFFGGNPCTSFNIENDNFMSAIVSNLGDSGDVEVTDGVAPGSLAGFTYLGLNPHRIDSFAPESAYDNDIITIYGAGFLECTDVNIGGIDCSQFQIIDDNTIKAPVPIGAADGEVVLVIGTDVPSLDGFIALGTRPYSLQPPLNRDNFLLWKGTFGQVPIQNIATDDAATMAFNAPFILIDILANDISTNGIDFTSIQITLQDNGANPATWNASTQQLKYYLAAGAVAGDIHTIKYTFKDVYGNASNEASVVITVAARATAWRGIAVTLFCLHDGEGHNTGYKFYEELEQYYTDDGTTSGPQKSNNEDDPDYIAPVLDETMCPLFAYTPTNLRYDNYASYNACNIATDSTVYFIRFVDELTVGSIIYTDSDLTIPAPDGFYSQATTFYEVRGGAGTIIDVRPCGA